MRQLRQHHSYTSICLLDSTLIYGLYYHFESSNSFVLLLYSPYISLFYSHYFRSKGVSIYIMVYNVIQYTYPDGSHRWKYFTSGQCTDYTIDKLFEPDSTPQSHPPGWTIKRKEYENASRAKQAVYDLARSNSHYWDWFVTLTFSPRWVNRECYKDCYFHVQELGRLLTKVGDYWLFVPEHHKDGRSFHFHGLVGGAMPLDYAGRFGPRGREVDTWNIVGFPGYTSVQRVRSPERVCTYITKYITKDLVGLVPKGCHRYLRSRNLLKPTVEYLSLQPGEFASLIDWGVYHTDDELPEVLETVSFFKEVPIRYTLNTECMYIVEQHNPKE